MAKRQNPDILRWALIGAKARLRELDDERAAILKAFPALSPGTGRRGPARSVTVAGAIDGSAPGQRKRTKMSAAARKRISDAQKKRWAAQKGKG